VDSTNSLTRACLRIAMMNSVSKRHSKCDTHAVQQGGPLQRVVSRPISETIIIDDTASFPKLSDSELEEEKLRKLYDQARVQGNRKKKKEYKEKIAELNRIRKYGQQERNRSKS
jgi:hypothetical protein